ISVNVVDESAIDPDKVYKVSFFDTTAAFADIYRTTGYKLENVTDNIALIPKSTLVEETPSADGFVIRINNDEVAIDESRVGWQGTNEDDEPVYSRFPGALSGMDTNWFVTIEVDDSPRFVASPYEYSVTFSDEIYTTPDRRLAGHLRAVDLPMVCHNETLDLACDIWVRDVNDNGTVDFHEDLFVVSDPGGFVWRNRYVLGFTAFGESVMPEAGDKVYIGTQRPFSRQDFFQFSLRSAYVDADSARAELDKIAVVPNPYVVAASWERQTQIQGRGPRLIQFIHLPEQCTIQIFTVRGELVRTIEHDGFGGNGSAWWDLQTENGQDVAFGVYFYHVKAEGIGETVGKFALIK
ncbi:MAG: hypothetical protein HKN29_13860, partial [Rhodothermales bacterium]|nr:hypothetical protein [Rhodothermales bacterium]